MRCSVVPGSGLARDALWASVGRVGRMTRHGTIATLAAALVAIGIGASAPAGTPLAALEAPDAALNPGTMDSVAGPDRPAVPTARERALAGNPLWGIPLRLLTATRERPLFSPSRRPPAPPVVAAPQLPPRPAAAKPAEPDHPLLTIVGTIVGETEGIGVFIDQATNDIIRLHTGQDHDGWVLRSVRGRETMFEKESKTATLALAPPGALAAAPAVPPPGPIQPSHALIPVAAPAGNTWVDGDGQLIAPPQKTSQTGGAAGRSR
jgi:general secretion pathway protein N